MHDDYSCQMLPPKPSQIDLKLENLIDTEDEDTASASSSARVTLRSIMTQREMEILTNTNEINRVTLERMRFFACAQNDALFVMLNAVKHLTLDRR